MLDGKVHFGAHPAPDTVKMAIFFEPRHTILNTIHEFCTITLSIWPAVGAGWQAVAAIHAFYGILP